MMTAAMAFFSIALTLNLTGVRLSDLRLSDLRPTAVRSFMERRLTMASTPIIRYYDHLRLVYEVQSRMRELRRTTRAKDSDRPAAEQHTTCHTRGIKTESPASKDGGSRVDPPQQSGVPAITTDDYLETSLTLKRPVPRRSWLGLQHLNRHYSSDSSALLEVRLRKSKHGKGAQYGLRKSQWCNCNSLLPELRQGALRRAAFAMHAGGQVLCEPCRSRGKAISSRLSARLRARPNPVAAAVLGLIPGVGAMYNGQFFKGLIHVVIFAVLISISRSLRNLRDLHRGMGALPVVRGLSHGGRAPRRHAAARSAGLERSGKLAQLGDRAALSGTATRAQPPVSASGRPAPGAVSGAYQAPMPGAYQAPPTSFRIRISSLRARTRHRRYTSRLEPGYCRSRQCRPYRRCRLFPGATHWLAPQGADRRIDPDRIRTDSSAEPDGLSGRAICSLSVAADLHRAGAVWLVRSPCSVTRKGGTQ